MKYKCLECGRRFDEPRIAVGFADSEWETCPFCGGVRLADAETDRAALENHFEQARRIVASWPEWKRNIGHRLDPIPPEELS